VQTIDEVNLLLRSSYEQMSPHMKRAAKYLLENPEEVAVHSMRTIAKNAGIHPTTMVRLARELSFSGYNDLRAIYQNKVKQKKVPHVEQAKALLTDSARSDIRGIIERSREDALASLASTYENLDPELLKAVAQTIWKSSHLYLIGFRSSYAVASLLYYRSLMFTPDVSLLEARTSVHGGKLRYIKPGDVMIAIATEPYSNSSTEMVKYAAAKGADIIAITDSMVSPLAVAAKHVLLVPKFDNVGYDYLIPSIAIGNLIMSAAIRVGGKKSLTRLEYSDKHTEEFLSFD